MEKLLIGVHTSLAFMTGRAEFLLDTDSKDFDGKTEAEFLSKSITDVSNHYKVEWLDQKSIDWMNLVQCLAIVYGGRLYAIRSTPKPRPVSNTPPTVRNPNPPSVHRTPPPVNEFNGHHAAPASAPERELRTGEVAGIGQVEFPPDHPLMGGRGKPN